MKYSNGFIVLCFIVVIPCIIGDPCDIFVRIRPISAWISNYTIKNCGIK